MIKYEALLKENGITVARHESMNLEDTADDLTAKLRAAAEAEVEADAPKAHVSA